MSTQTTKAAAAHAVESAAAAVTPDDKGTKVTTHEELFQGHEKLINENGVIVLTDELFRNLAADPDRIYEYKGRQFRVISKRSGVAECGGKTLYNVRCGADTFEDYSIEDLKEEFDCDFRREKASTKTALGKAKFATDKLAEVIAECNDEELTKAYQQLKGLVGLKRAEEQKRESEERAKREKAERAKRESDKADKSADKMSNRALIEQVSKRCGISLEEARKMLGL